MRPLAAIGFLVVAVGGWLLYIEKGNLLGVAGLSIIAAGSAMLYVASTRDAKSDSARAEKLLEQADKKD